MRWYYNKIFNKLGFINSFTIFPADQSHSTSRAKQTKEAVIWKKNCFHFKWGSLVLSITASHHLEHWLENYWCWWRRSGISSVQSVAAGFIKPVHKPAPTNLIPGLKVDQLLTKANVRLLTHQFLWFCAIMEVFSWQWMRTIKPLAAWYMLLRASECNPIILNKLKSNFYPRWVVTLRRP